jgi:CRISPR-associated protein Cas2
MRNRYLVTYDITDDDRRTLVFRKLRGYGEHLQYSVFRCDLSDTERAFMISDLHPLIAPADDQILIVDLGPIDGRGATCITSIGRRYLPPERSVVIV